MRGQELSLETVVKAVLVLIVLVVIAFIFLSYFGGINIVPTSEKMARDKCMQSCASLRTEVNTFGSIENSKTSEFCKDTFLIDNQSAHCYDPQIAIECLISLNNKAYTMDSETCSE